MSLGSRFIGGVLALLSACLAAGCVGDGGMARLSSRDSLVADITPPVDPILARSQRPDGGPAKGNVQLPPPDLPGAGANPVLPVGGGNVKQASALIDTSRVRVKVRAWVNAKPIFDEEVMQVAAPFLAEIGRLSEPLRSEKMAEVFNDTLEQIIDQEVLYQDAVKRLEKSGSPKALEKMREYVDQEFDKQTRKLRERGLTDAQLREGEHTARKMLERNLIATEYARNQIIPKIQSAVSIDVIREYYEQHKGEKEFKIEDKVKWQDVFIAVGSTRPTVAEARRYAESLLAKCKTGDDFNKLLNYDDGDSKFRGGEGFGHRKGEIRPSALEKALFEMKDGQIGPILELDTGVHLFRLVKRDYEGQLPLNDDVQKAIRKQLENKIAEREYKRIVRELRSRAVVRIERELQ